MRLKKELRSDAGLNVGVNIKEIEDTTKQRLLRERLSIYQSNVQSLVVAVDYWEGVSPDSDEAIFDTPLTVLSP